MQESLNIFLDTTKSSALEVTQFSWVSWTHLIHNSSSLTMTIFMLYTEKEQVKLHQKNPSPRTFKHSPKTRLNEYKWLFNCNFLALMIHSYTCDNAQITGWRIILSWLMRLNFQKIELSHRFILTLKCCDNTFMLSLLIEMFYNTSYFKR